ncbi:MAG: RidA family protein [Acidovorax sp.]|jgi:reactive intermediate/imine deaminase|nr:RidA family protein [Acidovorax sp.]MDR3005497.1 RidA family protein [Acidovorax sp.]
MTVIRYPSTKPLPLSSATQAGGFLFLSGVLPLDEQGKPFKGDIQAETRAVLREIDALLLERGASRKDVVRAMVWLADLNDFAGFNDEYGRFFEGHLPARSAVQATLNRGARVEIEVQAWLG